MLTALSVSKFAIVDQLTLRWEPGFTVITGETGAGKSIIVDAIAALVGGRVYPDMVQAGANRSIIEGVFDLTEDSAARTEVESILTEHGIPLDDEVLIISREIAGANGRGVTRINGRAVPLATVQRVGEWLVDIHGQTEHLSLLRSREQLDLLDRYAQTLPLRQQMASLVRELRRVRSERAEIEQEIRRARREESLLRHEVAEIEAANLDPDEEADLLVRRRRLRNAERLQAALTAAIGMLSGVDEQPGAASLVGQAALHLYEAAKYDPTLLSEAEALDGAAAQADETLLTLTRSIDALAEEAVELESVEERALLIADLKRKYGESVAGILEYLEQAQERLTRLDRHDALMKELSEREAAALEQAAAVAADLSRARQGAASNLATTVQAELDDLGLRGTRLEVRFIADPAGDGLPLHTDGEIARYAFDETGIDRIELLIAPNPGEPPRPLARIASGGELARISLAIKTVLSQVDTRATLMFDEVDVGVGGRSAGVVGQKLWQLTDHHQVVCITHMPQVAAFSDHHLRVQKSAADDSTQVEVSRLEPEDRAAELSFMLGGHEAGGAALASARELLERARDVKSRSQAAPVKSRGKR